MLEFLKSLFKKTDPTAYNCEVYLHKKTAELYVLNAEGKLEGDSSMLYYTKDVEVANYNSETNNLSLTFKRTSFEYLGTL